MAHVMRMRHIFICDLFGPSVFFHVISQMAQFKKKKVTEHKKCVLIFSAILPETLLIPSSSERDMINAGILLFM